MTPRIDTSPYARWLEYFDGRREQQLNAPFGAPFEHLPGRHAVARSLARFELGESGDGEQLTRHAAATGDRAYMRSIELFVREEQQHARWLTILRERFGGVRLTSHWSDTAFVVLRHVGGLRREICVLLTAELIALSYYTALPLAYDDPLLRATCERILRDERGHVAFHRATLSHEFARMPAPVRGAAILAWRAFVATTAAVVAWDHRHVLELAGLSRRDFARDIRARARRLAQTVRHPVAASASPAPVRDQATPRGELDYAA
ncbi:MAG TPA: ferritin-like domain-containing protein [Solirubrobacteraceae bacterium]|nr:ferritin-like domain-containing protein [Solirubrobacteraceae bacterium]